MAGTDPLHDALSDAGEHFAVHVRYRRRRARRPGRCRPSLTELASPRRRSRASTRPRISRDRTAPRRACCCASTTSRPVSTPGAGWPTPIRGALDRRRPRHVDGRRRRRRRAARPRPVPPGRRAAPVPAARPAPLAASTPTWIDIAAEWVFGDQRPDAAGPPPGPRRRAGRPGGRGRRRPPRVRGLPGVVRRRHRRRDDPRPHGIDQLRHRTARRHRRRRPALRRRRAAGPVRAARGGGPRAGRRVRLRLPRLRGHLRRPRYRVCPTPSGPSRAERRPTGRRPAVRPLRARGVRLPDHRTRSPRAPARARPDSTVGTRRSGGEPTASCASASPSTGCRPARSAHDVRGDGWELLAPAPARADELDEVLQAADGGDPTSAPPPTPTAAGRPGARRPRHPGAGRPS